MSRTVRKKVFFRLGIRISIYCAVFSGLTVFLAVWFLSDLEIKNSFFIAGIVSVLIWTISYLVLHVVAYKRLNTLEQIAKNISRRRFEEYDDITTVYNDELDTLIRQLIKSSRTVEREIQRLNRIENYRKEFIGDISHELKTPIFAIQGFIETLLNGALEDKEVNRSFLKKAMRNVSRLIYLTKDLMEISKLETGELKSEKEEFYLYETVFDVIESLNHKAGKDHVRLVLVEFDKNLRVKADKNQIKQILINLVENGIKYNVAGGKVEVSVEDYDKMPGKVQLSVLDTGMGIDEADLPRVTERFFRVDKSRSRERGGTGLGLAIVKHIIEAHGEQLFYKSAVNKGSVFSFTLRKMESEPVE